jgi:hypothetical protein
MLSEKSHIEVTHYDDSQALLDFRDTAHYSLYDLGTS